MGGIKQASFIMGHGAFEERGMGGGETTIPRPSHSKNKYEIDGGRRRTVQSRHIPFFMHIEYLGGFPFFGGLGGGGGNFSVCCFRSNRYAPHLQCFANFPWGVVF